MVDGDSAIVWIVVDSGGWECYIDADEYAAETLVQMRRVDAVVIYIDGGRIVR